MKTQVPKSPEDLTWWEKLNPSINFVAVVKAIIKLRKLYREYFLRPRRRRRKKDGTKT